jgi:hypothetical protein
MLQSAHHHNLSWHISISQAGDLVGGRERQRYLPLLMRCAESYIVSITKINIL